MQTKIGLVTLGAIGPAMSPQPGCGDAGVVYNFDAGTISGC
jgi:hypothetical protein